MKKNIILIILNLFCIISFAQTKPIQNPKKKIKIILLGVFHFNQSLDSTSKLHSNLFTEKRQKEVDILVNKLVKQKPDKVFLEFTPKNQPFYDSVYNDYLKGKEPTKIKVKASEFFQLGMKTAKKLGHKKIIGMNYQPEELGDKNYKPLNEVDKKVRDLYLALGNHEDSTRTNAKFNNLPTPYSLPKQDSLLQKSTLTEFILQLNSPKKLMRDEYTNWNYMYSMGTGNDMNMTDYVGMFWYGTNLRNFNNVLRQADYEKDNCYLLIYGSSHVPFLKYLFEMHPYFEVVDLNEILE